MRRGVEGFRGGRGVGLGHSEGWGAHLLNNAGLSSSSVLAPLCSDSQLLCLIIPHPPSFLRLLLPLQEQAARVERYKALLAPFILRRLKSEVASQLIAKKQIVEVRGRKGRGGRGRGGGEERRGRGRRGTIPFSVPSC
jgi:hypothetical protein